MRDNNKFNVTTSKILWLLALFFSIHSYAQSFISTCGEDFHGNGTAHQDCIEDIVVTSTESEGAEGTLFSGIIYSEGKINIIPGVSKVRILYENHSDLGRTNGFLNHRTKIGGNGGNTGNSGRGRGSGGGTGGGNGSSDDVKGSLLENGSKIVYAT